MRDVLVRISGGARARFAPDPPVAALASEDGSGSRPGTVCRKPERVSDLQRFKLTIAYRGTAYHGWQRQAVPSTWRGPKPKGDDGLPSVQQTLEAALVEVLKHPLHVVGSSRTDAGVHAKGQVCHVDSIRTLIPEEGFRRALNHQLPDDILVKRVERVPMTFHSIFSTLTKRYQYAIWNEEDRPNFKADLFFHRWRLLDVDAMKRAASHLVGTHDFASFCKPGHKRATTVRTVHALEVNRRGPVILIGCEGSGFLWNQVRIMVGAIVQAGDGEMRADDFPDILAARDRRRAGKTAPAQGLYLQWIKFGDKVVADARGDAGARGEDEAGDDEEMAGE